MITQIKKEKYLLISFLVCINALLSTLATVYPSQWYVFLIILALSSSINSINVLLILGYKLKKYFENHTIINTNNENITAINIDNRITSINSGTIIISKPYRIIYVVPCYNETHDEIARTIKSIFEQKNPCGYSRQLVVICDGKIPRKNKNDPRLDEILVNDIFKDQILDKHIFVNAYKTWDNKLNNLELYTGKLNNELDFILIIKPINYGKRDSLALVRNLLYYYNKYVDNFNKTLDFHSSNTLYGNANGTIIDVDKVQSIKKDLENGDIDLYFMSTIIDNLNQSSLNPLTNKSIFELSKIDFLIGTDADTILDSNCTVELINAISSTDDTCIGVVGYVDIDLSETKFNPLVMYQYAEYTFAQYLKRFMQSKITHKVNCLSGCVQLLKICDETCGTKLMNAFNRLPAKDENIFNQIRSYASEDRNHLSHMFALTPYVTAIQAEKAIAYTHVPTTLEHFFRQRKRWTAGATSNDMLLVMNSKHNLWERINSASNIIIYAVSPFVFVATVEFIIAIVYRASFLMLYLSIIMIIPLLYSLSIPLIKYKTNDTLKKSTITATRDALYYYICMMVYIIYGSILNLCVYIYTFWHLDDLNWNMIKLNNNDSATSSITNSLQNSATSSITNSLANSIRSYSIENPTLSIIQETNMDKVIVELKTVLAENNNLANLANQANQDNQANQHNLDNNDVSRVTNGLRSRRQSQNIYQISDETLITKVEPNSTAITQEELNTIVNRDVPQLFNGVRPRTNLSRRITSNIVSTISNGTRFLYNGITNLFRTNTPNQNANLPESNTNLNTQVQIVSVINNLNDIIKENNEEDNEENHEENNGDMDDINVVNKEVLVELEDLQYENDRYENQQIHYNPAPAPASTSVSISTSRSDKTTSIGSDFISNRNTILGILDGVDNNMEIIDECFDLTFDDDDNFVELEDGFKLYDSTKA